ncbi:MULTISPECIES: 50S ribosomal protein L6 [Thermomonospora]|uniref:Large ribosomal subunit protein uL6 n=1 Tax=Thermomonospora curvata (strain ATCC 19995 / DSM 43183 / JCM 3096 / KCTC 9072 / NBRC 15933 / NCIMB 10081 / Henssen B9) TaxID=471852 RepID=D1A363_THECD|nr:MULTISPECIES: 50S ribosomal protein L6 [Thermomonospora]ACY99833.1 ribosomal protein L6 [Thermomonospora curvata DSM 43183]PKK12837.1 MAG: 50S ribosomal protein L6 [Thermomonospora sp. CIF 1]
MSRIGRLPIPVPSGVDIKIDGREVTVKGPKGELKHTVAEPIEVTLDDGVVKVTRPNDINTVRALHGLTRTLIANMVEGVTKGYTKTLEVRGVGYTATSKGPNKVELKLGYSHPIEYTAPEGITLRVETVRRDQINALIHVDGIDKQKVGETAAKIRKFRKPDVYKGKGVRYEGEQVRKKVGKAGK